MIYNATILYLYLYIYIERERERERVGMFKTYHNEKCINKNEQRMEY